MVEVSVKGSDEWQEGEVIGKRKGFIRFQFADGKSKWLDLSTTQMRGMEETSSPAPPPTPVMAGEEEVVETVAAKMPAAEGDAGGIDPEAAAALNQVTRSLNYQQQGAFFLNAYWREFGEEAETIWDYSMRLAALDKKKNDGIALDEVKARQFLQEIGMPMARQAYLDAMRTIDVNNDRKMSLLEFLMFSKSVSPSELMSKPQDGMTDDLENALMKKEKALQALADLEAEKAELAELAEGTGVKAMQARTKLSNFKVREFKDAQYDIDKAQRNIGKARKSPELREKGTEFFTSRGGEHARPKKAAKVASMMDNEGGEEDAALHENVQELWQEELMLVIRSYNFKQQAGFFLNAYWEEVSETAEVLWEYALSMAECNTLQGDDGSCLDEGQSAQFFRANVEDFEMTATQLRRELRGKICLNSDKRMSLVEFLLYQFELDVHELMTREQGGQTDIIRKTTHKLKEIAADIRGWEEKIAKVEQIASGTGVKASGAKNQLAQGYGQRDLDDLRRAKTKQMKLRNRAEQSEEITEPGFIWIMEREEQFIQENPQYGR